MSDWKAVWELKVAEIADKLTAKFEVEYLSAAFDPKHLSVVTRTRAEEARSQPRHEMIKSLTSWVVSLAVVVLLVTAGYRLLGHQQWHRVVPPDSMLSEPLSAASGEVGTSAAPYAMQTDQSQAVSSLSGLHQRLLAMTKPQRNQILYLIIRDAGAKCTEVVSSQYFAAASGVWHSDCGDAQNFSIVIDDIGGTSVRPIPYEDVVPVLSTELR